MPKNDYENDPDNNDNNQRVKPSAGIAERSRILIRGIHWLRHTGISEDVKHRPREHVRDDAGHSSSAITDKYIDVELRARHASAKKKLVKLIKSNS